MAWRKTQATADTEGDGPPVIPADLADPAHEDYLEAADVRDARDAPPGETWMHLDMAARRRHMDALIASGLTRADARDLIRAGEIRRPRWRDAAAYYLAHGLEP